MSFESLVGQPETRVRLSRALMSGKLSHAVLLAGSAGSGKRSWGRALAQAIICRNRGEKGACLNCEDCRLFDNGSHPDYFQIKPEGRAIKIDQIRSLRERFHLRSRVKVCLIEQAETMTGEAASSLLKILEDPPPGLHFILLAEKPRLLHDTILSRCQRYTLQPLGFQDLTEILVSRHNLSHENAAVLARISKGLPGYAAAMAENGIAAEKIEEARTLAVNLVSGKDSARQLLAWAASMAEREDLLTFLELFCLIFRNCLQEKLGRNDDLFTEQGRIVASTDQVTPQCLEDIIILVNDVANQIKTTNVNRRLLLEKMLILTQRRLKRCQ
ncbi:MAG: DNA polymerase III subunit delta' [Bacillota bacterium]|nr:DNA polymerase III subunit delta' [Bacillota bacterium]